MSGKALNISNATKESVSQESMTGSSHPIKNLRQQGPHVHAQNISNIYIQHNYDQEKGLYAVTPSDTEAPANRSTIIPTIDSQEEFYAQPFRDRKNIVQESVKKKARPEDSFDNASVASPPRAQKKENVVHLKQALNALNCCTSNTAVCGYTESSSEVLTPETPRKASQVPTANVPKDN